MKAIHKEVILLSFPLDFIPLVALCFLVTELNWIIAALASRLLSVLGLCFLMKLDRIVKGDDGW